MIVVSDTSPLLALAHLRRIEWLEFFFSQVVIPPAVADELVIPRLNSEPVNWRDYAFIQLQTPIDQALVARLRTELDRGEAEAIALAIELDAATLLVDEQAGRQVADRMHLRYTGVLGLLKQAKDANLIALVRPALDDLRSQLRFYVSDSLYERYLASLGE